jgi:hypothetical protein
MAVGVIGGTIIGGQIRIKQLNPYAIAVASLQSFGKATQISGNAFIRIKAKHPVKLKLCACNLQQKSTMSTFGNLARCDILLP